MSLFSIQCDGAQHQIEVVFRDASTAGTTCFFALDQFEQPTHRPGERQNLSIERGIGKPLAVTKKRYLGVEVDDALEIVESIDV